jgi:dTDP-4-amino-4,6-dideoxygalactose transaminase
MKSYQVVRDFEDAVSSFASSPFAVAVDSCTNALFLCCKYLKVSKVTLPSRTYVSVPCSVIHAGGSVEWKDYDWRHERSYLLDPYPIRDSAHKFERGMFDGGFHCISFSANKAVNIGKGGMILTDDAGAVAWFKKARYCGRSERPLNEDNFDMLGWNMYMTPEQAARGLLLMQFLSDKFQSKIQEFPDLSKFVTYKN